MQSRFLLWKREKYRGYYVDTEGKNAEKIKEYIRNQLQEDYRAAQITLKEYYAPFTGESTDKSK